MGEIIPRGSALLMHLLFQGEKKNHQAFPLVTQENLAPVYINMFEMRKEKLKNRDKLFIQHKY